MRMSNCFGKPALTIILMMPTEGAAAEHSNGQHDEECCNRLCVNRAATSRGAAAHPNTPFGSGNARNTRSSGLFVCEQGGSSTSLSDATRRGGRQGATPPQEAPGHNARGARRTLMTRISFMCSSHSVAFG